MAAHSSAMAFIYPHPTLSKIIGKPSYAALKLLQKEIYANARTVFSTRGGGNNGHLCLVMPALEYLIRTIGVPFNPPVYPGAPPTTSLFITLVEFEAAHKVHAALEKEFRIYNQVGASLKAQLLVAIDSTYTNVLEDPLFGFADVTPLAIMMHLRTHYGQLKPEERGAIRESLRSPWNPDDPIEDVWTRTIEVVRTLHTTEPVPDSAIIRDQLFVFEQTGVFPRACEAWREKDIGDQTVDNLKIHFARYNEERVRTLTAKQAGYHIKTVPPSPVETANAVSPDVAHIVTDNLVKMFYCWTHGLGTNPNHCSSTCKKKAEGHKDNATADKMMDGNDRIMKPFIRAQRALDA
jgi:hypothetical protein